MKHIRKKGVSLLLALAMLLGLAATAFAMDGKALDQLVTDNARYIYETVSRPQVGSVGGEWAVIGLARSGYAVPRKYYQDYYRTVEQYVEECKGVLHKKKYTEYSRLIVALSAIGKDARDVAGYDLTLPLGDYDKTIWQGLNGPIWALIALDSRDYPMPRNPLARTQATRQMYIDCILSRQVTEGGWNLTAGSVSMPSLDSAADPDITGMALQALAKYQDQPAVKEACEKALACMSRKQDSKGGFTSEMAGTSASSESVVQIIVGLCEMGISLDDPRFVKNGNNLLDNLMGFYEPGRGFQHSTEGGGDLGMSTEQGFYGIVAIQRAMNGKNSLYRMDDAVDLCGSSTETAPSEGLSGKDPAVNARPVVEAGKTFADVKGHANQAAIEDMASRQIIKGKGPDTFAPDARMTRAEFSAIVVRALGLADKKGASFSDVTADKWYAREVGTASAFGIIKGVGEGKFNPSGTITRQEAAVMVARAAKLCGLDTAMNAAAVRDSLSSFSDYVTVQDWAQESMAFCYANEILDSSPINIEPTEKICRAEIAQMLYNLLGLAQLR